MAAVVEPIHWIDCTFVNLPSPLHCLIYYCDKFYAEDFSWLADDGVEHEPTQGFPLDFGDKNTTSHPQTTTSLTTAEETITASITATTETTTASTTTAKDISLPEEEGPDQNISGDI